MQNGVARIDGEIFLTVDEISFQPFKGHVDTGTHIIKRKDIASIEKCIGKGGGVIPLTSDAIRIKLFNHKIYEFVLANPDDWIDALNG